MNKISFFLFLLWFLSGCVQNSIIDDINIEAGASFDQLEEEKFIGSILVQRYLPDNSIENKTFTAEGFLRRDLLLNIQKQSSGHIASGGLMITIFGDKLADSGIIDFVDTYQRDPSIGSRNFLVTSAGSALDIIQGEFGTEGTSAYLNNLILHNIDRRDVPMTNLHIFLRDYYKKGKDPYLPELKKIGPKEVEISGLSLFKKDREVDVLPKEKMFYFKLMADKHSTGSFRVHLKEGEDADVVSITSKNKYKISKMSPSQVTLDININGVIREFTGKSLTQSKVNDIEKTLEKNVEKECLKLIKRFQEKDIDPLGFGYLHNIKIRGYDFNKWEEDYQKMTVNINCQVRIVETGVIK